MSFRDTSSGVLTPFEAEHYVKALRRLPITDVASDKWMKQHEMIEKLNMQAHFNALTQHDEFVVDLVSTMDTLPVLVHELLVIEVWKEKVLPHLFKRLSHVAGLKAYVVMYHEATIINLLEVLMHHSSVCSQADDEALAELVDYCMRKVNALNRGLFSSKDDDDDDEDDDDDNDDDKKGQEEKEHKKKMDKLGLNESDEQALSRQLKEINFKVAVSSVTVLRYLTEHLPLLPISITARMLDTHDVIMALVPLVESPAWTRRVKRQLQKYYDQQWHDIKPEERYQVTRVEGQVWLALYNLMMNKQCRKRYHFNSHRKSTIVVLKKYFNDILLDQLPPLRSLQRTIEELSLMDAPAPTDTNMVVIEQITNLRSTAVAAVEPVSAAQRLADEQLKLCFSATAADRKKDLDRLVSLYNLDNLDSMLDEPVCAAPGCGKPAMQRCSRCKLEWYCDRKCQVKTWKAHKPVCDLVSADNKRDKQQQTQKASQGGVSTVAPQKTKLHSGITVLE